MPRRCCQRRLVLLLSALGCGSRDFGATGPSPQAAAAGEDTGTTACSGAEATVSADYTIGRMPFSTAFSVQARCVEGPTTVAWDFGDGDAAEGPDPTHTWLGTGTHRVRAVVTDGAGAQAEAALTVTVLPADCPRTEAPTQVGALQHPDLDEASGLGASTLNPGVLWTHNDSGDVGRFFAMTGEGTNLGTWTLAGAPEGDWEDMALATDPRTGQPLLLLGDIGDNAQNRDSLVIYAMAEPALAATADPVDAEVTDWWSFQLQFADGVARNADAMLVDPVTGDLFLAVIERDGRTGIHRAAAPLLADTVIPLEPVAAIDLAAAGAGLNTAPMGADFSPLGDRILLRTADQAWLLNRDRTAGLDAAWAGPLCPVPLSAETGGEGIAFSADGAAVLTVSEGLATPIGFTALVPPDPPCARIEARIQVHPDPVAVGRPATLSVDPICLPDGVVSAVWQLGEGGGEQATPTAEGRWLASGLASVSVSVVDGSGQVARGAATLPVVPAPCPIPGDATVLGRLGSSDIHEASGLGDSALNPGVLWTHNDSGDGARLFALAHDGRLLGTYTLDTPTRDWEDLSLGWDDNLGAPAIYVGDIGDNAESRESIVVLVVPEPHVDPAAADATSESLAVAATLTLTYPDGPHNSETLMVDPVTGDLLVVTKDYGGDTEIFVKRAPHVDGTETPLVWVAQLQFGSPPLTGSGATTAGDFSPLGDRIAIRTYSHAWLWRRDQADDLATTFAATPCDLDAPNEVQGEALAFTADDAGYLVVSEGDASPIRRTPLD